MPGGLQKPIFRPTCGGKSSDRRPPPGGSTMPGYFRCSSHNANRCQKLRTNALIYIDLRSIENTQNTHRVRMSATPSNPGFGSRYSFPPGFIPLSRSGESGVLARTDGACEWVEMQKGQSALIERVPTRWFPIPETVRVDRQRKWLQRLRKECGMEAVLAATGKSRRTWEGWEQGRTLPFHQAAVLAVLKWKNDDFRAR